MPYLAAAVESYLKTIFGSHIAGYCRGVTFKSHIGSHIETPYHISNGMEP